MSFKPEVIADSTGKWYGNTLRFATYAEAFDQVTDLMARWTAVSNVRVIAVDDPVTHRYVAGQSIAIEPQHNAHVETYHREMAWRCDQRVLSNGGTVVAECGTILGDRE